MSNVLSDEKKKQVIALGQLGWPLRRIEKATGVRRETATGYLKAAGIAVRPPGGWGKLPPAKPANNPTTDPAPDSKPAKEATTDFGAGSDLPGGDAVGSPGPSSACDPYRETIELGLSRGRNATAIWQDLVDQHGFAGGYQSVKRFVRRLRGVQSPEARAVILTKAGEETQVDYGTGPMVRDPHSGKYRRTRLFVLTLGFSRKSVRLLVFRSSAQTWAQLHELAFRRLGGATRVVVLDNLREGVLSPDIYDPSLNPLYRDVLAHYGAVAMPCRIQDPDRKGKVEAGVGHAQKTPLKGLRFESLEQAQAYLDRWEERWADTRIHGTTKRQVAAMFAEEKPALQPLPLEPFRYYQYGERTVHLDGCVEVEAAYYSAPPGWISRRVAVQWDGRTSACSIRKPDSCCASISAKSAAGIGSKTRIDRSELRSVPCNCWRAPKESDRTSALFARRSIGCKVRLPSGASKACCPSPASMARREWMRPAPPLWKCKPTTIVSCVAIWSGTHSLR